jgi:hypothetical protein
MGGAIMGENHAPKVAQIKGKRFVGVVYSLRNRLQDYDF